MPVRVETVMKSQFLIPVGVVRLSVQMGAHDTWWNLTMASLTRIFLGCVLELKCQKWVIVRVSRS